MKQSLQLKTSLKQKLTSQMQQSLQILQLASQELADAVQAELDQNPLLEESHSADESDDSSEPKTELEHPREFDDSYTQEQSQGEQTDLGNSEFEPHWEELLNAKQGTQASSAGSTGETPTIDGLQNLSATESLTAHLLWQIRMTALSERDVSIARVIFHNLDTQGYLTRSVEQMASDFTESEDIQNDEIAAVLSLIKTLEPIGVGARNLSERLIILLKHQFPEHGDLPFALAIVQNHLELLAKKNWVQLRSQMRCSKAELERAITLVTSISPHVTSHFGELDKHQIIPDLLVQKSPNTGKWQAKINPKNQHRLRVNEEYAAMLKTPLDEASNTFINSKLQDAKAFIKNLMSRYDTLALVGQEIVERQHDFFEHGELGLKAMVLSDVANALDLHESTISRATAGKYLQCPQGVFELKYFFSTAVGNASGEGTSTTVIRSLIKRIIEDEDKGKPLSDAKIVSLLVEQNHQVARRTVAKYRESLGILPASQRKIMQK